MAANIDCSNIKSVGIYPPIGIARVGNSVAKDGWFYGPEVPERFDIPKGGFKDEAGALKRQAARFRVYALDANGGVICEANKANGFNLEWHLEITNKKASWYAFRGSLQEGQFDPGYTTLRNPKVQADGRDPDDRSKLIITSGEKKITGINTSPTTLSGEFYGSQNTAIEVYLGEAFTDEQGHLVVLAGHGYSRSIADPEKPYPLIMTDFDSPDWVDDTSDGRIWVTATRAGGYNFTSQNDARVIGTTPKFANGIYAPTTLYDVIEEVYEQEDRKKKGDDYHVGEVDWYKHIWPLLQRPPQLSWVNEQANRGHGPNGPGNFFEEKWQESLSDKSDLNKATRQEVLGRMRLPSTNAKYDKAREGQAYPYFMPWLSGDGGRTTAGDASTFASITELQYDRLVEWSKGNFVKSDTPPPPPQKTIDDVPLQSQPAALTRAALEPTIGAPLYPGIEMSWNAEQSKTYDLDVPFTIRKDVKSGDLTKYLSLPWQSDFYMCRSYWWPSARPDAIVEEAEYKRAARSVRPSDIAKAIKYRVPWERGIHQNFTDQFEDQPLYANTDMAQRWHELGVIVQRPSEGPEPIFVEVERNLLPPGVIPGKEGALPEEEHAHLPRTDRRKRGGITLPKPDSEEEPIKSIESLRDHLQTAMAVELSTIPLYLYAIYSIKLPADKVNDARYYFSDPVIGAMRGVVAEEMLHLSLAGNALKAIGGTPKLYDPDQIPVYPMLMPGRIPNLWLNLRRCSKANMQTFIDVEKPEARNAKPEPEKYHTLGQFYDAIKRGFEYLNEKEPDLFDTGSAPYQFAPGIGYQPRIRDAGGSVVITDLESAIKAITIIVNQGEGNSPDNRPFDDKDHLEKDHYDVFLDLKHGSREWNTYKVKENPHTISYWEQDKKIYHVSLAFDAAYCFLLLTIERLWTVEKSDARHKLVLGNLYGVMMGVLAPLAKYLVQQELPGTDEVPGPCFSFYKFDKHTSALKQVQAEMQNAINAYLADSAETSEQVAIHNYGPNLEKLIPVKQAVDGLVDLDTFEKVATPAIKPNLPGVQSRGAKGFARGS